MDQSQIVEVARAIANQSLQDAWPYWLAVLSLGILVSVGGAFGRLRRAPRPALFATERRATLRKVG